MMVGFSAGSATDLSARTLAPKLSDLWGQPVVIENRTGAGSSIANAMAAQATPDGYTLLVISASFAINAVLRSNAGYDPLKDFTSVSQIGYSTGALVVTLSLLPPLIAALATSRERERNTILQVYVSGVSAFDYVAGKVMAFVGTSEPQYAEELVNLKPASSGDGAGESPQAKDDMYDAAVEVIIREGRGSVSLLQRALGVGYGRGARLIDYMAEDGVVGMYAGSDRKSTRLNSSHSQQSRMPSSA